MDVSSVLSVAVLWFMICIFYQCMSYYLVIVRISEFELRALTLPTFT